MRAMFVLAAILSFAAPQVSWGAIESSLSGSGAIVLAAPASGPAHIVRAVSKTDKTFGTGVAIGTDFVALFQLIGSIDYVAIQTCDAPHLALDAPPLAPRPPPFS